MLRHCLASRDDAKNVAFDSCLIVGLTRGAQLQGKPRLINLVKPASGTTHVLTQSDDGVDASTESFALCTKAGSPSLRGGER